MLGVHFTTPFPDFAGGAECRPRGDCRASDARVDADPYNALRMPDPRACEHGTADRALRRRGRRRKSVEDMGTEPVSRWNVGVLEVRRRITNHSEAFHYVPRPDIVWI